MEKQEKTIDLKLNTAAMVRDVNGAKAALAGLDRMLTAISQSAQLAARAETKLASTAKAARRSLMGIDQIQRLNAPTSSGKSSKSSAKDEEESAAQRAQAIADKIQAIVQPLKNIQFTPLMEALGRLKASFASTGQTAAQTLGTLQQGVLTPFATWMSETFAPAFTQVWDAAMTAARAAMEPVKGGIQNLWTALQPVVSYIGSSVVAALQQWQAAFETLGAVFAAHSPQITGILTNMGTVLTQVWNLVSPVLEKLRQSFSGVFSQISQAVASAASGILQALYGVSEFLAGSFTGNWKQCWDGLKQYFQGMVNGLIGLLNTMLSRLGTALNSVITAANRLRFTVPDWVPGIGGSSYGLNMPYVTVPQVPYLAKGAVLPANKPFLAMVGDQKSGTNVEAPLATIQQAVRLELAGFETSVDVQRQILEAVLGIEIGDAIIGTAAERYNRRQAVIRGGVL